jgi:hypothetical protein
VKAGINVTAERGPGPPVPGDQGSFSLGLIDLKKYEYKIVGIPTGVSIEEFEAFINTYGAQGWKLSMINPGYAYFEKEITLET